MAEIRYTIGTNTPVLDGPKVAVVAATKDGHGYAVTYDGARFWVDRITRTGELAWFPRAADGPYLGSTGAYTSYARLVAAWGEGSGQ